MDRNKRLEKIAGECFEEFCSSSEVRDRHFIVVHGGNEEQREELGYYLQEKFYDRFVVSSEAAVMGKEYYNISAEWAFSQAAS